MKYYTKPMRSFDPKLGELLIPALMVLASLAPTFAQSSTSHTCPTNSNCWPAPLGFMPFQSVYYITPPNAAGDRLVVGKPFSGQQLVQSINSIPIADANTGPKFCGLVQLAPGLAVQAYLPPLPERQGDFAAFAGQLIDPLSGIPFPAGIIPLTRFADIFAWRIHDPPTQVQLPSYSAGSTDPSAYPPLQKALNLGQDVGAALGVASAGVFACSTSALLPGSFLEWLNGLPALQGQYAAVSMGPVDIVVTDALGRVTSRSGQAIPDSAYFELDFGGVLPHPMDVVLIRQSVEGQGHYTIGVEPDSTAKTGDAFSLVSVSGSALDPQGRVLAMDSPVSPGQQSAFVDLPLVTESAASSTPPGTMASGMIMISVASGLARGTASGTGDYLPDQLLETKVTLTDSVGNVLNPSLFFVDPSVVIFAVPPFTALGNATLRIQSGTGGMVSQQIVVDKVLPSLFTANASGSGVPAGLWIRIASNGARSQDYLFNPAEPIGSRIPVPVNLGSAGDQVFLSLYGTGFRNAGQAIGTVGGVSVPAALAAVGGYEGEDAVNIGPLPSSLAGRGQVDIVVIFDGKAANTVTTSIR